MQWIKRHILGTTLYIKMKYLLYKTAGNKNNKR